MSDFLVKWAIDIEADSPENAATEVAKRYFVGPDWIFDVVDGESARTVTIDLESGHSSSPSYPIGHGRFNFDLTLLNASDEELQRHHDEAVRRQIELRLLQVQNPWYEIAEVIAREIIRRATNDERHPQALQTPSHLIEAQRED